LLLQGQEVVAENALDVASKEGQWVVLQVGSFMYTAADMYHSL